jgi:hypothetical protein
MEWLAENWFWVLIGVVFIVMHLFGHGGHGRHGGHEGHGEKANYENEDKKRKSQTFDNSRHGHH